MNLLRAVALAAGFLACVSLTGCIDYLENGPRCESGCVRSKTEALANHTASFTTGIRITENGEVVTPDKVWLSGATSIRIHSFYAITESSGGQALVLGTGVGADGRSAVFGLRTLVRGYPGDIKEAEMIVTHQGEASLFPPSIPIKHDMAMDGLAPRRNGTQSEMIAAANAYFDGIEAKSGTNVPVTPNCERVENGVQTTGAERPNNPRCNTLEGFDYIQKVRDRRFPIFDPFQGILVAAAVFDIPGGSYPRTVDGKQTMRDYKPRSLLLFEVFKMEKGKIRHIQATMRDMPLGAPSGWAGQPRR